MSHSTFTNGEFHPGYYSNFIQSESTDGDGNPILHIVRNPDEDSPYQVEAEEYDLAMSENGLLTRSTSTNPWLFDDRFAGFATSETGDTTRSLVVMLDSTLLMTRTVEVMAKRSFLYTIRINVRDFRGPRAITRHLVTSFGNSQRFFGASSDTSWIGADSMVVVRDDVISYRSLTSLDTAGETALRYFPLSEGRRSTYRRSMDNGETVLDSGAVSFGAPVTINGFPVYPVSYTGSAGSMEREDAERRESTFGYGYNGDSVIEIGDGQTVPASAYPYAPFYHVDRPASDVSEITQTQLVETLKSRIEAADTTVTVPLGTFNHVLVVYYELVFSSDAGYFNFSSHSWYAPDVGLVRRDTRLYGPETPEEQFRFELIAMEE